MKKTMLILAAALTLAAAPGARAADKSSDAKTTDAAVAATVKEAKGSKSRVPKQTKKTELTGSYIKREVRRNGQITDGPNPVLVIDSNTIRNSGASDIRQLLTRQGANR